MGVDDNSTVTTRAVVSDYFDWRLNQKTSTTHRVYSLVRHIGSECETSYRSKQPSLDFQLPSSSFELQTWLNIKTIHHDIAEEMFINSGVTWPRIIAFISFSAMLAERLTQEDQQEITSDVIHSSIIDWTTEIIQTDLQAWLQTQHGWVGTFSSSSANVLTRRSLQAGLLRSFDKTPQRRTSIGRYAGILGTFGKFAALKRTSFIFHSILGMFTLGALFINRMGI